MMRRLILCAALFASACELTETTVAESADVVIAEFVLRTDRDVQAGVLHRSRNGGDPETVPGAHIEVRDSLGRVLNFRQAGIDICLVAIDDRPVQGAATCYISDGPGRFPIVPGQSYSLHIETPDGRVLTGNTRVPQTFQLLRPTTPICSLAPDQTLPLSWTSSADAWIYASEANLRGLRQALEEKGIVIESDPVRLFGLSLSDRDTTIVLPTEFGLFERFDDDLTEALIAIQNGLPAGVVADVTVAAADRNYVNWERGGNFNPSGPIRVPSVRGNGIGVFGALVPRTFSVRVGSTQHPPC